MQEIINFIVTNYRLILEVVILIISVIVFILRKNPVKVIDGVREDIFKWCLAAVSIVEDQGIVGPSEKLDAAVDYVYSNFMDKYYPHQENEKYKFWIQYADMTIRYIEAILSTPQKHKKK